MLLSDQHCGREVASRLLLTFCIWGQVADLHERGIDSKRLRTCKYASVSIQTFLGRRVLEVSWQIS